MGKLYYKLSVDDNTFIIGFHNPLRAVSSTVIGNGVRELTHVVFSRVGKEFNEEYPGQYAGHLLARLGLPRNTTAVFLTAADLSENVVELSVKEPVGIELVASIGLAPLSCMGNMHEDARNATINILLVVDEALTDNALLDLAMVAASSKTLALVDLGASCGYGGRAFSTVTDALIVASNPDSSKSESYGGPSTKAGSIASSLVYKAIVSHALERRGMDERFRDIFGVDLEWVIRVALKIYEEAPVPGVKLNDVEGEVRRTLYELLRDPNTWALGLAARSLDYHGLAGTIPGLRRDEYLADSKKVLADELLGISLALYINGWKAMFSYYWIDRMKNTLPEFKDKPMFIDDILASLIGSILSKIYDKLLSGGNS